MFADCRLNIIFKVCCILLIQYMRRLLFCQSCCKSNWQVRAAVCSLNSVLDDITKCLSRALEEWMARRVKE